MNGRREALGELPAKSYAVSLSVGSVAMLSPVASANVT